MFSVLKDNEPNKSLEINLSQTLQIRRLRQNWDLSQKKKAESNNIKIISLLQKKIDYICDSTFISNFMYLCCPFLIFLFFVLAIAGIKMVY